MRIVPALLLLVLAAACSSAEGDRSASGPGQGTAAPASGAGWPNEDPLPCVTGVEPFDGPAAARFGAAEVMSAYCWLVDLARAQERTSLARPLAAQRLEDLAALRASLTRRARAGWEDLVRARLAGEPAAGRRVDGLLLHDVRRPPAGYATESSGPYLFGTRYLPGTAELADGGTALKVTFALETGIVLKERGDPSGRHSLLPVTRTASYVLVPDGDGWLIEDWRADFEHGQVRLVTR